MITVITVRSRSSSLDVAGHKPLVHADGVIIRNQQLYERRLENSRVARWLALCSLLFFEIKPYSAISAAPPGPLIWDGRYLFEVARR